MNEKRVDVLVLGSGIAGITAGIYLRRGNISCLLLDKDAPGGKLNNIHLIDNYPGLPNISGPDFAMALVNQANELGIEFEYGEVTSINKQEDGVFLVKTDNGDFVCSALIVATGVINPPAGVPNERAFLGKGVSYCATCDGNFFKGKDVLVYGYKDHAVEDAIYLSSIVNKVYFLHNSPLETPDSHLRTLEEKSNIVIIEGKLLGLEGEGKVESAKILVEEKEETISISAAFPLSGEVSSSQFLSGLGVLNTNGFIHVNEAMETNVEGIYACGDIIKKKLRQLVNAAGEGAVAANSAISYIHSLRRKAK